MPATNGSSITASFGVDLGPLRKGFAQAKGVAKQGAAQVATTINTEMSKAGRAVPFNRAAFAQQNASFAAQGASLLPRQPITAARFAPAPAGKYTLDEEVANSKSIRSQVHTARFVAGLIAGAGAQQVLQWIEAAADKATKLRAEVSELTKISGPGAFVGFAELNSNLSSAATKINEISSDKNFDQSSIFRRGVGAVRDLVSGQNDTEREELKQRLRKQASADIDKLAEKQKELNAAEQQSLLGHERRSELLKEEVNHKEKLGALAATEAAAGVNNPAARNSENSRNFLARFSINKKFDDQEKEEKDRKAKELDSLRKQAGRERERLSQEALRAREESRRESERAALAAAHQREEEQRAAEIRQHQGNLADLGRFDEWRKTPRQRLAETRRQEKNDRLWNEFQRTGGLVSPRFGMNGQLIGGIDPASGKGINMQHPNASGDVKSEAPLTKTDMGDLLRQYFGDN